MTTAVDAKEVGRASGAMAGKGALRIAGRLEGERRVEVGAHIFGIGGKSPVGC